MAPTLDFNALKDLHDSANTLLHSPVIQQALVHHRQEKWVHHLSEESLTMLDTCGISKDVLCLVKQHLLDLHFTLRRVIIGEKSDIYAKISAYNRYRKKLKKETLKCLQSLRGMKNKSIIPSSDMSSIDPNLAMVVDVLKEVRVTATSIVESLFSLISSPWLDAKSAKGFFTFLWSSNHHQCVCDFSDEMAVQSANKRMEAVEIAIEDLEVELECMFRRLIQTRVLLLNILTP